MRQGRLELAAVRDDAMAQAEAHASAVVPAFTVVAQAFVLGYLRQHGPTAGEVVTDACKAAGIRPHDDRAFGAVYMGLARAGRIAKVGSCARRKGHLTAGGNVWAVAC